MGAQVAGGGDVNADGYDDVIVSYGTSAMGRGGTNVFSGATGAILHSFRGYATSSSSGSGVSFAGDVNADGHTDIIVGGHFSGRADVYSGADGSVLHATGGPSTFGDAVSGIGDIDNDGHDDFVVGSKGGWIIGFGKAYVYSGLTGQRIYIFEGDFYFDDFGGAVSGAGDVNGDGVPDIAVSAQGFGFNNAHNRGYIRLYSGATGDVLYAISGSFSFRYFGRSMRAGGDINGDGIGDVIAGAHLDGGTGKAYVFSHTFDGSETVCVGHSHSGGVPTRLVAESQSGFDASLNDTVLRVENLPGGAHAMAMIIGSPGYGVLHYPDPGGMQSDGVLCVSGGPIGRFNRPGQVHFGMPGSFSLPLDLNEIPWTDPNSAPAYSATLLAGDTWYFQCWYRDVHSHSDPAVTGESNFSDAIRITFK
ncbi:MAG: VCBS repeat-containing protein [Planctomycetota bacterium]|nr:VCBS repeat-containing protein [Planctomycetota bacterium]